MDGIDQNSLKHWKKKTPKNDRTNNTTYIKIDLLNKTSQRPYEIKIIITTINTFTKNCERHWGKAKACRVGTW